MKLETKTTLLRTLTRAFLLNGNPSTVQNVLNTPGENDCWCEVVENHLSKLHQEIQKSVCRHLNDYHIWRQFEKEIRLLPNGVSFKICNDSIITPYSVFLIET